MKRLQIPENLCTKNFTYTKKFYVHEITAAILSKIYFLKNAKKTWTKQPRFTSRLNNYRSASIFTFHVKNIWKNHDRVIFPVFLKHTFKVLDRFQKNLSVQQCLVSIIEKSKHAVDNSKASKALLFHLLKACGGICLELLTDLMSQVFFYTSWKYQKTSGFLIFSGVIERYQ